MSNVVNGGVAVKTETMTAQPTAGGSYVAVDPNTGLSYKVELPNGPISTSGGDVNDPLAAIMNETIFTETGAATGGTTDLLKILIYFKNSVLFFLFFPFCRNSSGWTWFIDDDVFNRC